MTVTLNSHTAAAAATVAESQSDWPSGPIPPRGEERRGESAAAEATAAPYFLAAEATDTEGRAASPTRPSCPINGWPGHLG